MNNSIYRGKWWAAIKDDKVLSIIPMSIPYKVEFDFDKYRASAIEALKVIGTVRSGEMVEIGGKWFFKPSLPHRNRSKNNKRKGELLPVLFVEKELVD